jgi:hypothetical protein
MNYYQNNPFHKHSMTDNPLGTFWAMANYGHWGATGRVAPTEMIFLLAFLRAPCASA